MNLHSVLERKQQQLQPTCTEHILTLMMESLIATDWLKEYDPLFDLFDEEMRANQAAGCFATSNYVNDYECYDLNYNCNALGGYLGGFLGGASGSVVGGGQVQDKHSQLQQQTDDMALVLGLEWLPCHELNSPTSNGSSNVVTPSSSSAPSPTLGLSSAMPTMSNQTIVVAGSSAYTPAATGINITPTTNSISKQHMPTPTSCFSSSALTPHTTSNHCKLSSTSVPSASARSSSKKVSTPSTNLNSSSTSVKAWKRKCLKQRGGGTSLLAHPSPVKTHSLQPNNQYNTNNSSSSSSSSKRNSSNISRPAVPLAQRYCIKVEHAYAATLS